ncbi:MAG: S1 RNA-binding domain-containing protein [Oscillospiraceae bacterium]|nr:S1 RNA-binding domain-containing protein [Oscillospiraceae bacterium]
MQLEIGSVIEGKIAGITKFGAFVTLPEGKSGLVHISEIADTFVNDVREHLCEGQTVKVRILSMGDNGKMNLSIKKAEDRPRESLPAAPKNNFRSAKKNPEHAVDASFEDKLKQFMQESDSKISGNRLYADKKNGSRRRRS